MTATKQQPIAGYRISDPSDPTIKPWLSDTPDDNGYTSEPLYAGAAPAAVAGPAIDRAATLAAIDDISEPSWTGYECPNTWADGLSAARAVVQSAPAAPALEAPAAPAAPNGWKLVPVKPTIAMLLAGDHARISTEHQTKPQAAYAAMLAAAPQAPDAPSYPTKFGPNDWVMDIAGVIVKLEEWEPGAVKAHTIYGKRHLPHQRLGWSTPDAADAFELAWRSRPVHLDRPTDKDLAKHWWQGGVDMAAPAAPVCEDCDDTGTVYDGKRVSFCAAGCAASVVERRADAAAPAAPAVDASDTALLDALAAESMDLRCFDMPTGQGDADVGWRVIQHHMGEPTERVVAEVYKDDPRSAIRAAIARLERDPYCTGALHEEAAAQAAAKGEHSHG